VDLAKAIEELEILRGFIDFLNREVGVYSACLAGFEGNRVRIERQIARAQHAVSRGVEHGHPTIVYASVEDPKRPDVIHHRIVKADEFIAENSQSGFNEQQTCWGIVVFIFTFWDDEIRPQIAKVRGVPPKDVRVDALGDLRILRNSIVHRRGRLSADDHAKLKIMAGLFRAESYLTFSHEQMHQVFVHIKQAIAALILEYTGHLPGAPDPNSLVDIAISRGRPPD
jgi:hypothetical protein